jgi:hypothetical protein
MGHGRHVTGGSAPAAAEPTPVADYNVATNPELNPDCSCNYFYAGTYEGKPYYRREDGAYFICWSESEAYWNLINDMIFPVHVWRRYDSNILGEYQPVPGTFGIAVVSAGPH